MFTNNRILGYVFASMMFTAAFLIAACGPAERTAEPGPGGVAPEEKKASLRPSTSVEVAKERGGKFTYNENSAFGNPNDPHLVVTATGRAYSVPVTNWLLKRDVFKEKQPVVGDLAKSWEVSKDGLTYTFKLREGIKFHNVAPVNGREMTSEDVRYSLRRIMADPELIVEKWKPRFQRRLDLGDVKSIDTPDKYTVVISLKEPFAPFVDAIAHPGTQILPREFIEKFPEKIITEGAIGTGPFMPVEYKNQQLATYKKNPDYWKKDSAGGALPYIDDLNVLYFADPQTALAAFRARNLDFISGSAKNHVDSVKKEMPDTQILTSTSLSLTNFRFNMKYKPFEDVRVRRAIHLTLDRQQFLDIIAQGEGQASGPVTPKYGELANTMDWLLSQPGYRHPKDQDIAEAKRLMKEAGYEDGFAMTAMISTGANAGDWASLLSDQLKPLKITVKPDIVDYAGQWVPKATAGEFELSWMSHKVASDADSVLGAHLLGGAPRNYGKFDDPELNDFIKKQQRSITVEERRKWAQEAEKRAFEVVPMVFLYDPYSTEMAQPWVHNVGSLFGEGTGQYVDLTWITKH